MALNQLQCWLFQWKFNQHTCTSIPMIPMPTYLSQLPHYWSSHPPGHLQTKLASVWFSPQCGLCHAPRSLMVVHWDTHGALNYPGYLNFKRIVITRSHFFTSWPFRPKIWAGITKFATNMHPGILSAGIENGGHWPWPSRSFWPFWLRILGNLACPHHNSSQIWAWITKFATNMHPGILSAGIENRGHWLWPSRSFWQL